MVKWLAHLYWVSRCGFDYSWTSNFRRRDIKREVVCVANIPLAYVSITAVDWQCTYHSFPSKKSSDRPCSSRTVGLRPMIFQLSCQCWYITAVVECLSLSHGCCAWILYFRNYYWKIPFIDFIVALFIISSLSSIINHFFSQVFSTPYHH